MRNYRIATKKEIIEVYIELCHELGKVATKEDVRRCNYICSPDKIVSIFGSWKNFVKISKVCKNGETAGMPLKEKVEKVLVEKRIEFERRLDTLELNSNNGLPTIVYVQKLYGGKSLGEIWDKLEEEYNITYMSKYDLMKGVKRGNK